MSEEEIIKYAKVFSTATGSTHKIHFVNDNKTINEPDLWKETLNLIDKLQKENEQLKEDNKFLNFLAHWNNQGKYYPYLATSYTDTSYFVKKDKIVKTVNKFVEEMNELLGE